MSQSLLLSGVNMVRVQAEPIFHGRTLQYSPSRNAKSLPVSGVQAASAHQDGVQAGHMLHQ